MKRYNIITNLIDSDGELIKVIEDRELSAEDVIELLTQDAAADAKSVKLRRGPAPAVKKPKPGNKGCTECGSPSKHKKTCSKSSSGKSSKDTPKPSVRGMSRMTFGRVKISQSHDVSPEKIASNLDLDLADVEKAFDCEAYDDYLNA